MPVINSIISMFSTKRLAQIDFFKENPIQVQRDTLVELLRRAADTEYGLKYDFDSILTAEQYRERLPIIHYEELAPYSERLMNGEQNLLWPEPITWFAKSSGTTAAKSKFIPVSKESLESCHFRGGKDVISIFNKLYPDAQVFNGKTLALGGSSEISKTNNNCRYGDLSAILISNTPFWANMMKTPDQSIMLMSEWEEKIEKICDTTIKEDVRSLAGVPSWFLTLINRILERTGISAPVQSLLDTKLTGGLFSRQEAALTTELVYGYLRSEIRISWLLSQFMKAPEKLPASMKLMIGIAAYELLYLDRIPAHASVSAAVDAVRARFGQGLSRVANGVLRSLIRLSESEDLKAFAFYESRIKDPMERLSVFHSVPRWMLELWTKGYGPEKAETFARAVSVVPSPCVRVNAARDEWEALRDFLCKEGEAVGISGVRFAPGTQPEYMRDYLRQGRLSIQGAGSQLALEALDAPRWEGPVWDACAGRGGKTLALVELGVPVLAASDTYQPRLRGMRDDAKRLVLKTPPLFCASAAEPALRGTPRTILLDVPCSGLGTLARHPDLRTLRTPGQVAGLVDLQRRILDAVWSYLPSGGHLAYITCTMNPAENEGQIDAFLARTPGASLEKQWQSTPDAFGSDLMYGAMLKKA